MFRGLGQIRLPKVGVQLVNKKLTPNHSKWMVLECDQDCCHHSMAMSER